MASFPRVYHHYTALEEYKASMWRITTGIERRGYIEEAANLMREPERFEAAMLRAVNEWPISCEHALTAESTNRIAWLGHAGCCIEVGSPEEATRAGWHTLTAAEQDEANASAAKVLEEWEKIYGTEHRATLFTWAGLHVEKSNRH